MDLPAAGSGIASQNPSFERISGPVSCAPTMTGALDQTSAAASRLSPDLGKFWLRIELASRRPEPRAGDLRAPGGLQPGPGLAHGGGHRAFARRDLGCHHGDDVGIDVELQLHAGLRSTVQTSRSRSRTGSP